MYVCLLRVSGRIPTEICRLTELTELHMQINILRGAAVTADPV